MPKCWIFKIVNLQADIIHLMSGYWEDGTCGGAGVCNTCKTPPADIAQGLLSSARCDVQNM